MDTRTSPARLNIERIRAVLQAEGCAASLIPSSDPHLSEYLPERWQGRQWASGFTGFPAWLFWLFAHIYFLIGFRNRLIVMVDWAWAYFTYERSARVVAEPDASAPQRSS